MAATKKDTDHITDQRPSAEWEKPEGRPIAMCGRDVKFIHSLHTHGGQHCIEFAIKQGTMCRTCWKAAYAKQVKRAERMAF